MSKVSVTVEIPLYEIDGNKDDPTLRVGSDSNKIQVKSHGNQGDMVVLVLGGTNYTVVGKHLKEAVDRCYLNLY